MHRFNRTKRNREFILQYVLEKILNANSKSLGHIFNLKEKNKNRMYIFSIIDEKN